MYLVVLPNFPGLLQEEKVLLAAPTSGCSVTELFIDTSLRVYSPRPMTEQNEAPHVGRPDRTTPRW